MLRYERLDRKQERVNVVARSSIIGMHLLSRFIVANFQDLQLHRAPELVENLERSERVT